MKRKNSVLFLIVILVVLIAGIYIAYNKVYSPSAATYATYLTVHQEMEKGDIDGIHINSMNHNVIIKPSSDDKIRVVYYQKSDNVNTVTTVSKQFSLAMGERAENLDNLFFKGDRPIDTITISLPVDKQYSVYVESIDGTLTVENVTIKQLKFVNAYGGITCTGTTGDQLVIDLNTGDVVLNRCEFNGMDIKTISGAINVNFNDSIYNHDIDLSTTYGSLMINNQPVKALNEQQQEIVVNTYQYDCPDTDHYVKVTATRSKVSLVGIEQANEPTPAEPDEPVEPADGEEGPTDNTDGQ